MKEHVYTFQIIQNTENAWYDLATFLANDLMQTATARKALAKAHFDIEPDELNEDGWIVTMYTPWDDAVALESIKEYCKNVGTDIGLDDGWVEW